MEVQAVNGINSTTGASKAKNAAKANQTPDIVPLVRSEAKNVKLDKFGEKIVKKPQDLGTVSHEMKMGETLTSVASKYHIPTEDLVAQLKYQYQHSGNEKKGLAADYNFHRTDYKHDPKCLHENNKLTIYKPKGPAQEAEYKKWIKYERGYFNKCVNQHEKAEAAHAAKAAHAAESQKGFFSKITEYLFGK